MIQDLVHQWLLILKCECLHTITINLLLQGFQNDNVRLGHESADTFSNDLHKDLKVGS